MAAPPAHPLAIHESHEPRHLPEGPSSTAITTLLAANLLPLAGVLFFGWDLFSVILIYWLENGVIGLLNAFKIALARGPVRLDRLKKILPLHQGSKDESAEEALASLNRIVSGGRWFMIPFFLVHYGIFWAVHGVFVFVLFSGRVGPFTHAVEQPISILGIAITAAALAVSHGTSFFYNYLGRREFEQISPPEQMIQPYSRVVVLHLALLGGGFLVMLLGAPLGALILLIALKTGLDLRAHLREHRESVIAESSIPRPDQ